MSFESIFKEGFFFKKMTASALFKFLTELPNILKGNPPTNAGIFGLKLSEEGQYLGGGRGRVAMLWRDRRLKNLFLLYKNLSVPDPRHV